MPSWIDQPETQSTGPFRLLIDDTFYLLIDDTYRLLIEDTGQAWTDQNES